MAKMRVVTTTKGLSLVKKLGIFEESNGFYWGNVDALPSHTLQVCQKLWSKKITAGCRLVELSIKAVFFDFDSTLIEQESADVLANILGCGDKFSLLTQSGMKGEISFKASVEKRLQLLAGMKKDLCFVARNKLTLRPGTSLLLSWLRQQSIPYYLISGGFWELLEDIVKHSGFNSLLCNHLAWDQKGGFTGKMQGQFVDTNYKATWIRQQCRLIHIDPKYALMVGDGANDLEAMKAVGTAIGIYPKDKLLPQLNAANFTNDHYFIRYLMQ